MDAGEKKVEAEKAEEKPKADTKGKQNKEAKESVAQESKKPAKVEEPKTNEEENDGWIQVPTKPKGKKKWLFISHNYSIIIDNLLAQSPA